MVTSPAHFSGKLSTGAIRIATATPSSTVGYLWAYLDFGHKKLVLIQTIRNLAREFLRIQSLDEFRLPESVHVRRYERRNQIRWDENCTVVRARHGS